jgi:hypothetical protein
MQEGVGVKELRVRWTWNALALAVVLAGCATGQAGHPTAAADPQALYAASIYQAAVYRPEHARPVTVLPKGGTALVSTWTRYDYKVGETVLGKDLWVTVVPEVQERCRKYPASERVLRLQQLLGLPPVGPDQAYDRFAVMTVKVDDLFRPCTNPDPSDSGPCTESLPANVDPKYLRWFADNMLYSYQLPGGYPWTRLGYTYDWNPAGSHAGPSEFVARKGATVTVTAVVPTVAYCKPE